MTSFRFFEVKTMLVNQKELSCIIGITDRQIRGLRQEQGMFPFAEGTKKYNLAACVQEFIRYRVEYKSGSDSTDNHVNKCRGERS